MAEQDNVMKTLVIDENSIYKFKIEDYQKFDESFFREVYEKAAAILSDIIKNGEEMKTDKHKNVDNDYNNIIAFIGERGSGKTSSMISFSKSLTETNREDLCKYWKQTNLKKCYEKICNKKFHVLDIIDPSVFDNTRDSIVEIIVASMFKSFKKILMENKINRQNQVNKLEVIKNFEKVYGDIKILNGEKRDIFNETSEDIEALVRLASAINIKEDLRKLIQSYLKYIELNNGLLVICIDDLDMNIASGEKMIEEIRKYLVMPEVVILMAIRIKQLEMLVKQKNIEELSVLTNHAEKKDKIYTEQVNFSNIDYILENKTEKYLAKIIPYNKQVFMPEFNDENVYIKVKLGNINEGKELEKIEAKEISHFISGMYYDYLRYIVITPDNYNVIIPKTLRELVELLQTFGTMQPITSPNEKTIIVENIALIKQYFQNTMPYQINNANMVRFLNDLLSEPLLNINKKILIFLISLLKDRSVDVQVANEKKDSLLRNQRNILDKSVGIGDIVAWLKLIDITNIYVEEKVFYEVIKLFYSLRLIEAMYSSQKDIIYVVGKNIVGDYFSFVGTRYWTQIDELDLNIKRKKISKKFYTFLEPKYIQSVRGVNKISKYYVENLFTASDKENGNNFRYIYNPLNFLGVEDSFFNIYQSKGYIKNTIYDRQEKYFSEAELQGESLQKYFFIVNMDFYLLFLEMLNSDMMKLRLTKSNTQGRSFLTIVCAFKNIDILCEKIKENTKTDLDIIKRKWLSQYFTISNEKIDEKIDEKLQDIINQYQNPINTESAPDFLVDLAEFIDGADISEKNKKLRDLRDIFSAEIKEEDLNDSILKIRNQISGRKLTSLKKQYLDFEDELNEILNFPSTN